MRVAIIDQNNNVLYVRNHPSVSQAKTLPGETALDGTNCPGPGWKWNGVQFVNPNPPPPEDRNENTARRIETDDAILAVLEELIDRINSGQPIPNANAVIQGAAARARGR